MARDIFHNTVKELLIEDGWIITADPLMLTLGERKLYVDLGAEKLLTADKQGQQIAVEPGRRSGEKLRWSINYH